MYKAHQLRSTFGTSDVTKLHAAVARSAFPSQNAKKLTVLAHYWNYRCPKIARRCGAKRISKSKCSKTDGLHALLEIPRWKNGTPLWREEHVRVKMYKTPHVWTSPPPQPPILRGDLQKCNVHFSVGGGGLKMYLGPPPRGFQKGGGENSKIKCNQGGPTPFSTFFLAQKHPPPKKKQR